MNYKEEIFKEIAKFSKSFHHNFRPLIVSIGLVPMASDNRVLYSHPQAFKLVTKALAEKIKDLKFDLICGAETAGIPLAAALAYEMNKPFCYVRKKAKATGRGEFIEGDYQPGMVSILIDDLMVSGNTKRLLIENLAECGVKVNDLSVIWFFNTSPYQKEATWQWLKEKGIKFHYLYTWLELAQGIYKYGGIPDKLFPYYVDFLQHPEKWENNKERWQEYFKIVRKLNIKIPEKVLEKING